MFRCEMTAEKFIEAWIRSTFMIPKVLTFGNTNYYYAMFAEEPPKTAKKRKFRPRGSRRKRKTARKEIPRNVKQGKAVAD